MIVKQFIKGAAKLYAVEAGEVQEAGKLRDGYEAGLAVDSKSILKVSVMELMRSM